MWNVAVVVTVVVMVVVVVKVCEYDKESYCKSTRFCP